MRRLRVGISTVNDQQNGSSAQAQQGEVAAKINHGSGDWKVTRSILRKDSKAISTGGKNKDAWGIWSGYVRTHWGRGP